jgi:hypothetical protein
VLLIVLIQPLEGAKYIDQFALDGTNIWLNLATMKSISKVTYAKKEANRRGHL